MTRLRGAMLLVALLATLAAGLGAGVPSTHGGRAAVDEPEYLLTALSLYENRSFDISDELRDHRFLAYHDADLPVQTAVRPDGSEISPHDPLLPVLLAVPVGLGGWLAAKLTLAALGGILAALTLWVAVRRFAVPPRIAAPGVALASCSAPLAVYGQQVYPELPAALAATAAVAAITGRPGPRGTAVAAMAITALPWLSVKYVPVAAALTLVALPRLRARPRAALLATLVAAGIGYALVHRLVWGGWTAYASGDQFQRGGELGVVGAHPDYPGRTTRLLGLLVDRDFGIAAWQPAWLLLVPAVAALGRVPRTVGAAGRRPRSPGHALVARRPAGWDTLALPLAAGWATATWVALTMHGYWWPGRQLVVVLPLAVLAVLVWARDHAWTAAALAVVGVAYYAVLLLTGYLGDTSWVLAPDDLRLHPPAAYAFPDDRDLTAADRIRYAAWVAVAAVTVFTIWRRRRPAPSTGPPADRAAAAARTSR